MNAAEQFDWAVGRAMRHVDQGNGRAAMASLIADLKRHEGTSKVITRELMGRFVDEVILDGPVGARRFIQGLPRPSEVAR